MIIVTGTKRSGTSMWMQILKAAGYAIVGEAFPRDWASTIQAGNPLGFYESPLRRGIYFATNPDPRTGEYLCPLATQSLAVKVFVPGLLRTDLRFVHKVIATVRPWREYKGSVERLVRMEHQSREALRAARGHRSRKLSEPRLITPALAWWNENYCLLRDAVLRRYPLHLVSYTRVLEQPTERIEAALRFLGAGDAVRAAAQVREDLRTQHASSDAAEPVAGCMDSCVGRDAESVFDELYARVHQSVRLDQAFLSLLDRTHARLTPTLRAEQARVQALRRAAAVEAREQKSVRQPREPRGKTRPAGPRASATRPRADRAYP